MTSYRCHVDEHDPAIVALESHLLDCWCDEADSADFDADGGGVGDYVLLMLATWTVCLWLCNTRGAA